MHAKSLALGLCALLFAAQALQAAGVSFLVAEAGLPQGSAAGYSSEWEDSVFDALFEAGHVASNAPRISLGEGAVPDGLPPEAAAHLEDARSGGMGYFLAVIVCFPSRDVSLRLFDARTGEMVAQTARPGGPPRSAREESESRRRAAMEIAAFVR